MAIYTPGLKLSYRPITNPRTAGLL